MKGWWKWLCSIPLLFAISFVLQLPEWNCFAQDVFLPGEPFHTQTDLAPTVPALENNWETPTFIPSDMTDSARLPRSQDPWEDSKQDQENTWGTYSWSFFSLSLSTLSNMEPRRDISGTAQERSRLEMIRSLTSDFSDMPSRKRFHSVGEIFEPELKLGIEF